MAKIRLGQLAGQVSGSIGSTTYSRNRYGTYTRLRSKPVTTQSIYTDAIKACMSIATKVWQDLTDAERQAWRIWALTHPITDRLGDKQILDGHTACTQINLNIILAGGTIIDNPPVAVAPASLTSLTLNTDIGAGAFNVVYTPTPLGASEVLFIWLAIVPNPGIQFVKNLYKLAHISNAAQASPLSIETYAINRFGTLQVGQVVHAKVFVVDQDTGLKSGAIIATNTIIST